MCAIAQTQFRIAGNVVREESGVAPHLTIRSNMPPPKDGSVRSKDLQVVKSGERTNTEGKAVSSLILLSISDSDYSVLRPHLEYVSLPNHLVLHEAGGKLEF